MRYFAQYISQYIGIQMFCFFVPCCWRLHVLLDKLRDGSQSFNSIIGTLVFIWPWFCTLRDITPAIQFSWSSLPLHTSEQVPPYLWRHRRILICIDSFFLCREVLSNADGFHSVNFRISLSSTSDFLRASFAFFLSYRAQDNLAVICVSFLFRRTHQEGALPAEFYCLYLSTSRCYSAISHSAHYLLF